jgi:hypothetical protein
MSLIEKRERSIIRVKSSQVASPNIQWWRSFVVHLYGLQNDFDSKCYITLHG